MKKCLVGLIIAMVMPVASSAADDSPITRQQADEIVRELHKIRNLLQQPTGARDGVGPPAAAPRSVSMGLEKSRFIRSEKALLRRSI